MDWLGFATQALGVAGGGGIFGLLGALQKGKIEIQRERLKIDVEEAKQRTEIVQRETAIRLGELKVDSETIRGTNESFNKSLDSTKSEESSLSSLADLSNGKWWAFSVVAVEVFKRATRPGLTWGLAAAYVATLWEFSVYREQGILGLAGMAGTAVGWWFGSRSVLTFNEVKKT